MLNAASTSDGISSHFKFKQLENEKKHENFEIGCQPDAKEIKRLPRQKTLENNQTNGTICRKDTVYSTEEVSIFLFKIFSLLYFRKKDLNPHLRFNRDSVNILKVVT